MSQHESILLEAEGLINGDRQASYGTPEANFARWAKLCQAVGILLTPSELAMVMALGKIAREANRHKRDNTVDGAAYLDIYERLKTIELSPEA